jgi:hypothetical protein
VVTEDGYILEIHRIPAVQGNKINRAKNKCVFFQHGLLDSSESWVCNSEKNCLPFILWKKGFDVVRILFIIINYQISG